MTWEDVRNETIERLSRCKTKGEYETILKAITEAELCLLRLGYYDK